MTVEELAAAVLALDPDERKQFEGLIAPVDTALSRRSQYVADAVYEITGQRPALRVLRSSGKIDRRTRELFEWFGTQIDGFNETQIDALVSLTLKAVAYHMEHRSEPIKITPKSLLDNTANVAAAMDRAYPGYHKAGILYRLVPLDAVVL